MTFRGVGKLKHSCHAQEYLLPWSCTFTSSPRETVMGESPRKVRSVGESVKQTLVLGFDAREQGVTWGLITPLRMPSLLPHDLCHRRNSSRWSPEGKDPSSRATRRKRASCGCRGDHLAYSRVETGMSGNFLSCSKGVKYLLEVPEVRCD